MNGHHRSSESWDAEVGVCHQETLGCIQRFSFFVLTVLFSIDAGASPFKAL